MSSYLYFNYCINVNFLGSTLGYKKLLFPRRVLLTCLTAISLSMKTLCGSQSSLQWFYLVPVNATSKVGPWDSTTTTLLHLWGRGHLGCAQAVSAAAGSEPRALAASIPWAAERLRTGTLPWPCAGPWPLSPRDGEGRKSNPCTSVWERETEQNQCIYFLLTQFFFQRKTQTSQANQRKFFKMLRIPAWMPIFISLKLGMRQTVWLYTGLNKFVQKQFGEIIFTCRQSLF